MYIMSQYQFEGLFYISDNLDATSSNSSNYFFSLQGDTLRVLTKRTIVNSTDAGFSGEICYDADYIYYCVSGDGADGNSVWKRSASSSW